MALHYHPRRTMVLVFGLLVTSFLSVQALSFAGQPLPAFVRIAVAPFAVLFYFSLVPFDAIDNYWLHLSPVAYYPSLVAYYYALAYAVARLTGRLVAVSPVRVETPE